MRTNTVATQTLQQTVPTPAPYAALPYEQEQQQAWQEALLTIGTDARQTPEDFLTGCLVQEGGE